MSLDDSWQFHSPDLRNEEDPQCEKCGDSWPCAPVRDAWNVPHHLNHTEARHWLARQLDNNT